MINIDSGTDNIQGNQGRVTIRACHQICSKSLAWVVFKMAKMTQAKLLEKKHRHRRNVTSHHSLSHLSLLYFNFFNFHH